MSEEEALVALRLPSAATLEDVRRAFRTLSLQYHDVLAEREGWTEHERAHNLVRQKEISEAYSVLTKAHRARGRTGVADEDRQRREAERATDDALDLLRQVNDWIADAEAAYWVAVAHFHEARSALAAEEAVGQRAADRRAIADRAARQAEAEAEAAEQRLYDALGELDGLPPGDPHVEPAATRLRPVAGALGMLAFAGLGLLAYMVVLSSQHAPPSGVSAAIDDTGAVMVTWQNETTGESGFEIRLSDSNYVYNVDAAEASARLALPPAGVERCYQVRAVGTARAWTPPWSNGWAMPWTDDWVTPWPDTWVTTWSDDPADCVTGEDAAEIDSGRDRAPSVAPPLGD
jgi:hypothetical protein